MIWRDALVTALAVLGAAAVAYPWLPRRPPPPPPVVVPALEYVATCCARPEDFERARR